MVQRGGLDRHRDPPVLGHRVRPLPQVQPGQRIMGVDTPSSHGKHDHHPTEAGGDRDRGLPKAMKADGAGVLLAYAGEMV